VGRRDGGPRRVRPPGVVLAAGRAAGVALVARRRGDRAGAGPGAGPAGGGRGPPPRAFGSRRPGAPGARRAGHLARHPRRALRRPRPRRRARRRWVRLRGRLADAGPWFRAGRRLVPRRPPPGRGGARPLPAGRPLALRPVRCDVGAGGRGRSGGLGRRRVGRRQHRPGRWGRDRGWRRAGPPTPTRRRHRGCGPGAGRRGGPPGGGRRRRRSPVAVTPGPRRRNPSVRSAFGARPSPGWTPGSTARRSPAATASPSR